MKKIPTGIKSFRKLREENYYFVDKTLMIKDFLERGSEVTLITRPRRFGKTINMSMMSEFFDITKDSKEIFKGTKIMDTPYASELNQYPTIFISFADAKENKETIVKFIKNQFQLEYSRYNYIFKDMDEYEENDYRIINEGIKNNQNGTLQDIEKALIFLMRRLKKYYGKDVVLFIDEYDTPFIEANTGNFYQEIKGSLATLLRSSLKNSDDLKYAMLTGIQRVAKENIFSDLNNLVVCDVTDQRYASYFGFTNNETQELLEYYGLELNDEVKKMYDGYHIGNQDIYNPWSLLNYADTQKLISFWVNTSANSMIKNALKQADYTFKNQYDKLIKESKLDTYVSMQTSFFEEANNSTLWGLFVNAGYLTVTKEINLLKGKYRIEIPNEEVKQEFIKLTEYQLGLSSGTLDTVTESLVNEDQETFLENYQEILMIPSYHDLEKENSYHMMMLGMCLCLNKDYEIISNRKVGKGRDDLILKAKDEKRTSFVLEFKYLKEDKKALEEALDELSNKAIQQIKENKYDYGLKGKVIYIGLAHHGKNVSVKWENKI
ncbi:AAA family ATPase [Faecalibacillus intestinalis]|uniref:AAA family ATPase n=1 Tax=Faecalibacillus intestinalis TaxID=1982626 RepID=UPI0018AB5612|nr:AAA family ATPase [Faecalibacillus intestinalis]